jgi:hypothetical protein
MKNCENCAREVCSFMPPVGEVNCGYWKPDTSINGNWILCSERLPENNQQCLIYRNIKVSNLKMTTGIYNSDRQVFIGLRHGTALRDAIAWMPLPNPPVY